MTSRRGILEAPELFPGSPVHLSPAGAVPVARTVSAQEAVLFLMAVAWKGEEGKCYGFRASDTGAQGMPMGESTVGGVRGNPTDVAGKTHLTPTRRPEQPQELLASLVASFLLS